MSLFKYAQELQLNNQIDIMSQFTGNTSSFHSFWYDGSFTYSLNSRTWEYGYPRLFGLQWDFL